MLITDEEDRMSGYRGDGFGMHGDHGDDDYRREMEEGRREDRGRGRHEEERRGFLLDRGEGRGEWHERQRDWNRDDQDGDRGFMGRARDFFGRDDDHDRRSGPHGRGEWQSWDDGPKWNERDPEDRHLAHRREGGEGGDQRAIRAAEAYRSRYGTHAHEGQYGGGAMMDLDRHGGNERWYSDRERRHNFSGVGRFGTGSSEQQSGRGLHDDHYRSWRDRQMEELDRDYQDYCREREQEFGSAFESWRTRRRSEQHGASGTQEQRSSDNLGGAGGAGAASALSSHAGMQPGDPSTNQPGGSAEVTRDQQSDSLVADEGSGETKGKRK